MQINSNCVRRGILIRTNQYNLLASHLGNLLFDMLTVLLAFVMQEVVLVQDWKLVLGFLQHCEPLALEREHSRLLL